MGLSPSVNSAPVRFFGLFFFAINAIYHFAHIAHVTLSPHVLTDSDDAADRFYRLHE